MANVKVFVHATDTDTYAGTSAMTLAPWTYLSQLAKKNEIFLRLCEFV